MSRVNAMLRVSTLTTMLLIGSASAQDVRHVDDDAAIGGDGATWSSAYKYLQDALAVSGGNDEIRVAGGTYRPDRDVLGNVTPGDRFATFQLISGVLVSGGYRGCPNGICQGGDPNERDIVAYETILTGDLIGDDQANFTNRGDNSYHVVTGSGTDATAALAGLTISGGNADLDDVANNRYGGGMLNEQGFPSLEEITFVDNRAEFGGAMLNVASSPALTQCTFSANRANFYGGAIYNREASSPSLTECAFIANSARSGGAMDNAAASDPTLVRCMFTLNSAAGKFGSAGGAINNRWSSPIIIESEFIENGADLGGAIFSKFDDGSIVNCLFERNFAAISGGALLLLHSTSPLLINCVFRGNGTPGLGGAMHIEHSVPHLINCLFNANLGGQGGAIVNRFGVPTLTNCSLVGNRVIVESGAIVNFDQSTSTLTNSILWDTTDLSGAMMPQIVSDATSTAFASYSCIQSVDLAGIFPGQGNINDDPLFVARLGLDGVAGTADDDLRLSHGSPCIDAGDSDAVLPDTADLDGDGDVDEPTSLDAYNNPRVADDSCTLDTGNGVPPIVDMGAFEYVGDCNGNGVPDACDVDCRSIECLATGWDGTCGGSTDCDDNCVPDECQPDSDGIIDEDGDGVCFPEDQCPTDPAKTTPGFCGCGVSDDDTNGDTIPDCLEQVVIPTLSHWGLVILSVALFISARYYFRRCENAQSVG